MPPKSTKGAKKQSAAAKKKAAAIKVSPVVQNAPAEDTASSGLKRGRTNSVEVRETRSKKTKTSPPAVVHEIVDSDDEVASVEAEKSKELDAATKEKLSELKFTLEDHTTPSLTAIMDAIGFNKTRPETVEEMVEAVIEELQIRALAGQNMEKDFASVKDVDEKHWQGEYDVDPDGFDRIVRRRLNSVEDMVNKLTSMYLKDIIKELGFFARGGSNADMADEIVGILTHKAKNNSQLVKEYRIVKEGYRFCYGCCGEDSGLDGGDDGEGVSDGGEEGGEEDEDW